jgi:hypothetical protein
VIKLVETERRLGILIRYWFLQLIPTSCAAVPTQPAARIRTRSLQDRRYECALLGRVGRSQQVARLIVDNADQDWLDKRAEMAA